jgi:hypothetical protein
MKINKPGLWIAAIYLAIYFVLPRMFAGGSHLQFAVANLLVIPSLFLLEIAGIEFVKLLKLHFLLAIGTSIQLYIISHFMGYLNRKYS